jgi:superfamily II DNA or RNA helicase
MRHVSQTDRSLFENLFVLEAANNHWGDLERGKKIIQDFQAESDSILQIIASPRCLDQAVDIPRCDSTFMTCGNGIDEIGWNV